MITIMAGVTVPAYLTWQKSQDIRGEFAKAKALIFITKNIAANGVIPDGLTLKYPPLGGYGIYLTTNATAGAGALNNFSSAEKNFLTKDNITMFFNGDPNEDCPNPPTPNYWINPNTILDPDLYLNSIPFAVTSSDCKTTTTTANRIDQVITTNSLAFSKRFEVRAICRGANITNHISCTGGTAMSELSLVFIPPTGRMFTSDGSGTIINEPITISFTLQGISSPASWFRTLKIDMNNNSILTIKSLI